MIIAKGCGEDEWYAVKWGGVRVVWGRAVRTNCNGQNKIWPLLPQLSYFKKRLCSAAAAASSLWHWYKIRLANWGSLVLQIFVGGEKPVEWSWYLLWKLLVMFLCMYTLLMSTVDIEWFCVVVFCCLLSLHKRAFLIISVISMIMTMFGVPLHGSPMHVMYY